MKKIISLFFLFFIYTSGFSQELLATVQVNSQQLGGSNQQAYKALEKVSETLSIIPAGQGRSFRILKKSNVALPLLLPVKMVTGIRAQL